MPEQTEEEIREEFDKAALGLVTKGLMEVYLDEDGEECYRLTAAGLAMGAAIEDQENEKRGHFTR